ncbi:MAG: Mrp/NBP35 family ATP-binding protein [Candidatus Marinimicrobia bacterium]|nr:Mrp/NBP35 family ATP-binding protein [Candidatus Neomarinimicrobiota bacterium]MCF7829224.1 Mrp/NBP35 family ATP-binding protein [Candidatus Neomarinimicrobiota bacterium]MCF7881123.1 Mrp/NBP35 family ATP-binding protein [Candidatus Neomarinimicrobiota bacterium]
MAGVNQDEVKQILEQVTYPGFSRNIVSFGMVGDIAIQDGTIQVELRISSSDEEKKQQVVGEVRDVLKKETGADDVSVSLVDPMEEGSSPSPGGGGHAPQQSQGSGDPWADHHAIPNVKHVIAVASGKGGVGKSTVAANLAASLKEQGNRVGLLDLDIYGPSLPTLFGITDQPYLTKDERIAPLEKYGLKLMSFGNILGDDSPVIWRGPMVAKMVDQFLNGIDWKELDYLVLDLPPGTGDVQLTLVQKIEIRGAIIVTTPQELALQDVKKGANMFRKVDTPVLGIIENMSYFNCPHCGEDTDVFSRGGGQKESVRLGVPLLGRIPLHPELMEASDQGKPIVFSDGEAVTSKAFQEIAEKLSEQLA